nr:hypothetical protein [Desulfobacterales bacterium]
MDERILEKYHLVKKKQLKEKVFLCENFVGKKFILKALPQKDTEETQILNKLKILHPPCLFPRIVSDPLDEYMLYEYIPGRTLDEDRFDSPKLLGSVVELALRLEALFRTMKLASLYQSFGSPERIGWAGTGINRPSGTLLQRREELTKSYRWTLERSRIWQPHLLKHDILSKELLLTLQEILEETYVIHLPYTGNNICHTSFTPEHLIRTDDGSLALVSWHLAPRPRGFMIATYLAWSFWNSRQEDILEGFERLVSLALGERVRWDQQLVFLFCLLDTWVLLLTEDFGRKSELITDPEKIAACRKWVQRLITEAGSQGSGARDPLSESYMTR